MKFVIAAALIAALLPLSANAALSQTDSTYLTSAMQSQLGRYAIASLAASHASSSEVKSLAKSIATKASAQTRELDALAKKNGVPIAKGPSTMDSYHYSRLTGLKGKAFDQEFLQALNVQDQMVVGNDQSAIKDVKDPELHQFAQKRYTALKEEINKLKTMHA